MEMNAKMKKVLKPVQPAYLDEAECGQRYGFSARHWRRLVDSGKAPRPARFGRLVRWSIADLSEWESRGCPNVRDAIKGGAK